ncbi:ferritin-like domain-containing protein [Methylobacterium dankookense]|jgi:rubrerythrin|uniref:Rubrerythrin diiron-binding domain-containing protein n=1 Tax=Methylobacterium dankookense TaxID=560405 RepID=A0A564G0S6_9HYPH|nr:hypothetical protein IFDJLNFL_1465 [Methylobacterium dankookense]VUF13822.1 hypothetical protein MTDSW087_03529 [Methylobacterium dankookense]
MPLLKTEPPAPVRTLDELLAIAHAMEAEAATRYGAMAERMRGDGNDALAGVFERLSADEQGHIEGVRRWSEAERGKTPDPSQIRWKLPETFDDEGLATTDPRLLRAYRALAAAVRNEERAFAFWTYVAAQADRPEVRQAAEAMAHEELGHVAILRRERRRAFHAERAKGHLAERGDRWEAADLERRLGALLGTVARDVAVPERARLEALARDTERHEQDLRGAGLALPVTAGGDIPDDPVALAELLADRYLEAADDPQDEAALACLQTLAGHAVARLAWLRSDLPELQAGDR